MVTSTMCNIKHTIMWSEVKMHNVLESSHVKMLFSCPRYGEDERKEEQPKLTGCQLLVATFRHMKKPYQLLLIPITFWSGIEQGFFSADYTAVGGIFIRQSSSHDEEFYITPALHHSSLLILALSRAL